MVGAKRHGDDDRDGDSDDDECSDDDDVNDGDDVSDGNDAKDEDVNDNKFEISSMNRIRWNINNHEPVRMWIV